MNRVVILIAVLGIARAAAGQDADDYRGGWRTESGEAHIYEFSIRGAIVRGVYCTYCADATTLAFVDGTFGRNGITFEVTHVNADGSTAYRDRAVATFREGRLMDIAEYCCYDVKLTRLIHQYGSENQRLFYQNRLGQKLTVNVSW